MSSFRVSKLVVLVAAVAVVFGIVTLVVGSRVLLGADPGYTVFRPLLWFNTTMGLAYVVVGILAWRDSRLGLYGAATIALLNLTVLCAITYFYTPSGAIASTSLQAMTFRTAVWVALFLVLLRVSRSRPGAGEGA